LRLQRQTRPGVRVLNLICCAAAAAVICAGCAASHKTYIEPSNAPAPLQSATKDQLIADFNQQAQSVNSINAGVSMKLTAGSAYSGLIEQYHEVNGFILAQKPASIRVIGQAPVVAKNIFDMVSDGQTFRIFIPSKNKFLVGPATLQKTSAKPIENLRPQHLIDTLLWQPIPAGAPVLFEENTEGNEHSYILTVVRPVGEGRATDSAPPGSNQWEIGRKIWFDRTTLKVSRMELFGNAGIVNSDARYSNWQSSPAAYPREIALSRPHDDYRLEITINKITLNEPVAADRFELQQPPGTELVHVDQEKSEHQP
jgi:outer membrane lipoprotein-sorting protein